MSRKLVGLLLSAGYSKRTMPEFMQKCGAEVMFNGEIKKVVRHQIDMLKKVVDELYVVVWHRKEDLGDLSDVKVLEYEPHGIADVWRRFVNDIGDVEWFMSVNCDDLHKLEDYKRIASCKQRAVSVKFSNDINELRNNTVYDIDEDWYVVRVVGKNSSRKRGFVGTGVYLLRANDIKRNERYIVRDYVSGEYIPDILMSKIVNRGYTVKVIMVDEFWHVGEKDILSKMARNVKTVGG
jgi:hypothetical protein